MPRRSSAPAKGTPEYALFMIRKKLPEGMDAEIEAMDVEQLKQRIVDSDNNLRQNEASKLEDEPLQAARLVTKDLSAGYNDVKKAQSAIIRYALLMLESKGAV